MKSLFTYSCSGAAWLARLPYSGKVSGSNPGQEFQCDICSTHPSSFLLPHMTSSTMCFKVDARPLIASPSWPVSVWHAATARTPMTVPPPPAPPPTPSAAAGPGSASSLSHNVWENKHLPFLKQEKSLESCSPLLSVCSDDTTTDQKRYSYTTSTSKWEAEKRSDICFL